MASQVEIANMALTELGTDAEIANFDTDQTTVGRALRRVWTLSVEATLRAHPWNFAAAREALGASAESPPAFGWDKAYDLPADCLRVRRLDPAYHPVEAEWHVEGRQILTNEGAPLYVLYTKRVTDTAQFDPMFAEALAVNIAVHIAPTIKNSRGLRDQLMKDYKARLRSARSVDGQEMQEERDPGDFMAVRR